MAAGLRNEPLTRHITGSLSGTGCLGGDPRPLCATNLARKCGVDLRERNAQPEILAVNKAVMFRTSEEPNCG